MKISAIAILSVVGVAAAGRPQLSINVRDGNFADLDGLEPVVSWGDSMKSGDIDIEYGIEANARATNDLASLPRKIWGKASQNVGGWGVSARAEVQGFDFKNADLEIDANNDDNDLSVNLQASVGNNGFAVSKIEATKGIDTDDARVTINPRYNLETEEGDVVIGYKKGDTNVEVTASKDDQKIMISQRLDDKNRIAPSVNRNGDVSLEWERSLGDDNSVTATLRPNDSVDVEWKDSDWTASFNIPIDGTNVKGTNVSIKREVNF